MPKKSVRLKQEEPSLLYILPIAFVISVVPLIVFLKVVNLTPIEIKNWYGQPTYTDFFNYYKSQWLIIGTVVAAIFYLIHGLTKGFNSQKSFIYIPTGLYALMIVLSTVFSKYPQVALRGFVARYEGMFALLCYIALMLIVYQLIKTEKQIKLILGTLLFSASIIGCIGLFQFLGLDIFRSSFGKQLILPEAYHKFADSIDFRFEESSVFSTFSNPNYMGSYMAIAIPMAFASLLYFKNLFLKVWGGLLTLILIVNLLGSKSLAGLVGFCVSIAMFIVLFRNSIFKRWVLSIIVLACTIVVFFGVNFALKGVLVRDILSQYNQIIGNKIDVFDLKDIIFKDNTVSIISGTETLVIKSEDSKLYFYAQNGNKLEYKMNEDKEKGITTVSFNHEKYIGYRLSVEENIVTFTNSKPYAQFKFRRIGDTFKFIGINGDETKKIEKAKSYGFIGNERLGSNRGYIWSRTIPLLNILGYGPDTYALAFPQNDYIGKIRAFWNPYMIVDKPHNMYLQIGVNTGLVSLLAVLVLFGFYVIQSFRIYINKIVEGSLNKAGAGIFAAIIGYLVSGFFNDSVVGISPILWTMLGLGFACNKLLPALNNKWIDQTSN